MNQLQFISTSRYGWLYDWCILTPASCWPFGGSPINVLTPQHKQPTVDFCLSCWWKNSMVKVLVMNEARIFSVLSVPWATYWNPQMEWSRTKHGGSRYFSGLVLLSMPSTSGMLLPPCPCESISWYLLKMAVLFAHCVWNCLLKGKEDKSLVQLRLFLSFV